MFPYSSKINNDFFNEWSFNEILFPLYSDILASACGVDFSKYLKLGNYKVYP